MTLLMDYKFSFVSSIYKISLIFTNSFRNSSDGPEKVLNFFRFVSVSHVDNQHKIGVIFWHCG